MRRSNLLLHLDCFAYRETSLIGVGGGLQLPVAAADGDDSDGEGNGSIGIVLHISRGWSVSMCLNLTREMTAASEY